MLESCGVDSALARVALLDTDLLPSPLSLVTVAPLPFNFASVHLCVCIVGWGGCLTRVRTDDEGC